ncbi:MAG TPA: hypothetical protein VHO23_02725 [Candidatus Paceibacterota bacterium]|nr:hypothetical protein [Candidatus Paceibacterota bacterium]
MTTKAIAALVALIVLACVGYLFYSHYQSSREPLTEEEQEERMDELPPVNDRSVLVSESSGEDRTVRGTITAVDTEGAMVDGPVLIELRTDGGEAVAIAVPSMGLPLCAASASIADAFALAVGQEIEARGSVGTEGRVVPCESSGHYLRVVDSPRGQI